MIRTQGDQQFLFGYIHINCFRSERGQIGVCSPDPNRGSAQLAAQGQQAAGLHRGRRPAPKMGFHALSLAILDLTMSSMAVPLTSSQ